MFKYTHYSFVYPKIIAKQLKLKFHHRSSVVKIRINKNSKLIIGAVRGFKVVLRASYRRKIAVSEVTFYVEHSKLIYLGV